MDANVERVMRERLEAMDAATGDLSRAADDLVQNRVVQPDVSDEANFARRMAERREVMGMSQSALARAMVERGFSNYSQMTVSRTEKGERPIRLGEARVLADLLGSSVAEMTRGTAQDEVIELAHHVSDSLRTHLSEVRDALAEYASASEDGFAELQEFVGKLDARSSDVEQALSGASILRFSIESVARWAVQRVRDDDFDIGAEITTIDMAILMGLDDGEHQAAP